MPDRSRCRFMTVYNSRASLSRARARYVAPDFAQFGELYAFPSPLYLHVMLADSNADSTVMCSPCAGVDAHQQNIAALPHASQE
jgi:hypothetical protein